MTVGCGGDPAPPPEAVAAAQALETDVDPQSIADATTGSALSPEQRALLARARGREWEPMTPAELARYLDPRPDSSSAVCLWDPSTGVAGLRTLQEVLGKLDTAGIRVAVAVREGGNRRDALVALRESQLLLPAVELPRAGDYGFLPGTALPDAPAVLLRSGRDGGIVVIDALTPPSAYGQLLRVHAPL